MIKYFNIHSQNRPKDIEITNTQVLINEDIQPYEQNDMQGFEYNIIIYEKDEYIAFLARKNQELETALLDTQSVLCDIYEELGGIE